MIHRKKNDLSYKDVIVCVTASGGVNSLVNRLKIPKGLSVLLFRRWSEVPSRGGVHGDLS